MRMSGKAALFFSLSPVSCRHRPCYAVAKVAGRMEQVNASIARYLRALDRADREEGDIAEAKSGRLREKIAGHCHVNAICFEMAPVAPRSFRAWSRG
jgi:hypothetical protein